LEKVEIKDDVGAPERFSKRKYLHETGFMSNVAESE
jgi:hypothetical protein